MNPVDIALVIACVLLASGAVLAYDLLANRFGWEEP